MRIEQKKNSSDKQYETLDIENNITDKVVIKSKYHLLFNGIMGCSQLSLQIRL